MGIFSDIFEVGCDIVKLPVDIIKDEITLYGSLSERDESYTVERLKSLKEKLEDINDD